MATEEIKYDIIKQDGDIEIRDYAPVIIAEVTVKGSRKEAPSAAFRTLFNYITGENTTAQNIPMTAPVSQELVSREIPMTAPVTQEQVEPNVWKVAFYMPADMTLATAPKPTNDKVTIREVSFGKRAAIRFSGRTSDNNIKEHDEELKTYLTNNNIAFNEADRMLAFYNSPFVPWFLRRNEVLYPVKYHPPNTKQ